jgi:hypothetical protein
MGKIQISDDLRNKLDKVFLKETIPVGPDPSWNPPQSQQPPKKPLQQSLQHAPQKPPQSKPQQEFYYVKTRKNKIKYYKITKVVFISSIIAGIGITLGIKIANILFF